MNIIDNQKGQKDSPPCLYFFANPTCTFVLCRSTHMPTTSLPFSFLIHQLSHHFFCLTCHFDIETRLMFEFSVLHMNIVQIYPLLFLRFSNEYDTKKMIEVLEIHSPKRNTTRNRFSINHFIYNQSMKCNIYNIVSLVSNQSTYFRLRNDD